MMNTNKNNMLIHESEDHLYPEIYTTFAPVADQLIRDMEKQHGDIFLTEDLLREMINEAIRRTEVEAPAAIPTEAEITEDAIPTLYEFGRGRPRGNRGHWRRYDRGALDDIFRILFLQQIFGRRRPHWRCR